LQTKEGLFLRRVIQNTKICGILRAAVEKTFDSLNVHYIPCNLVANSMLTFPIPSDSRFFFSFFCCWGLGCVNLKKVIVFPLPRYIVFLNVLWPTLNIETLEILGSLRDSISSKMTSYYGFSNWVVWKAFYGTWESGLFCEMLLSLGI